MTPAPNQAAPRATSRLPSLAAMGTAMVSVQGGASLAKTLFPTVGAQACAALRVALAAVILSLIFRPWRNPPRRETWPVLLGYGAALGLMNLLFYSSLQRIPLGVAVAVEFAGPLGVAVMASRRRIDFLWIGLAAAGLVALMPFWRQADPLDPVGVLLALGAGVCWGLYIVFGKAAGGAHGAQATALGMIVAAVVVAPAGVLGASPEMLRPSVLAAAVGVAVLSSVLPYTLEMYALTRMPVRVFGVLMSLEPAVAATMGLVLLGEALSPRQYAAIAAIIAASLGVTLTMAADAKAEPAVNA